MGDFIMWGRVLTDDEIRDVASYCEYPEDYIIRPQMTFGNIEWSGEVEIETRKTSLLFSC